MLKLDKNETRKILDDFENKSKKQKTIKLRRKLLSKIFLNKYVFFLGIFSILFFVSLTIINILIAPPYYSDKETAESYERLLKSINETGKYKNLFLEPILYLEKYPYFYKEVVNNIQEIKFVGRIKTSSGDYIHSVAINPYSKTLLVYTKALESSVPFDPSILIHEANHSEYWRAKDLRKYYLSIKCSPIINSKITGGNISDTYHRFKTHEICAELEQVKFDELEDRETWFLADHGMFVSLIISMWEMVSVIFKIIISIFR